MSKLITVKNDKIAITISTLGAEIQTVFANGRDYLWNGDEKFWSGRAPVLFPICGGLKEDKYTFGGSEYTLNKHGFAKLMEFEVEAQGDGYAVFLLKSTPETKKNYPFDFELRIKYALDGDSVHVEYEVDNKSETDMYFSIGAHEAYACPEGIEEYHLKFERPEHLTHNELHGNLLSDEVTVIAENTDTLALNYEYFKVDAITMLNLKSRSIKLEKNDGTRTVHVDFDGFDYVFVWTRPGAGYICIEPWCGVPDFEGSSYDITEKRGINKLPSGETFRRIHTFTIEK